MSNLFRASALKPSTFVHTANHRRPPARCLIGSTGHDGPIIEYRFNRAHPFQPAPLSSPAPSSQTAIILTALQVETLAVLRHLESGSVDFDSAIPRFESWRPSQPVRSLRCDFQVWENRRHSGGFWPVRDTTDRENLPTPPRRTYNPYGSTGTTP